jgi:hypothetical protein
MRAPRRLDHGGPGVTGPAAALTRAALSYIERGWPAFVLSPTKVPLANCDRCKAEHLTAAQMEACGCLSCHGFYAATLDPARIREMARLHPRGLLAIRTGAVSGTVVIDVDPPGIEAMREHVRLGQLPRTLAARTGRGGYHLVYAHPGGKIGSGAGKGGHGVDVKADGAYIVAAPSVHPRTRERYRWLCPPAGPLTALPRYWAERLSPAPACPPPGATTWSPPAGRAGGYGTAALSKEAAAVAAAPPGQRNDVLNRAAFSLGQLVAASALTSEEVTEALLGAAAACGLAADDGIRGCETTIRSGLRGGMANPRAGAA